MNRPTTRCPARPLRVAAAAAALLGVLGPALGAAALPAASASAPTPKAVPMAAHKAAHKAAHPPRAARSPSPPTGAAFGRRADAMQLADRIAEAQGLDRAWTRAMLAQARQVKLALKLIAPPAQAASKNWAAYRERFVEPERIAAGAAFWSAHERWLDAARERYGVDPAVIVGIVGVETFYGRVMGQFRIVDALATLALHTPPGGNDRRAFFAEELGHWLALARRERVDPLAVRGSFAGAIGLGQFMPGSIVRWAVDFDGDGRIDMSGSAADVIGSIANYLAQHGWRAGMPTHYAVTSPPEGSEGRARLREPDIRPAFSATQFAEAGAALDDAGAAHDGPLALVELRNGESAPPSHVAGTDNFYAVTRYNRSAYYAMGVIALGQAVAAHRGAGPPPEPSRAATGR